MPSTKSVATFTFEGKRYYVRADSKEEAQALAQKKKEQLGGIITPSSYNVTEWFDKYAEVYKAVVRCSYFNWFQPRCNNNCCT